jgi:uncharacterized membrane protein
MHIIIEKIDRLMRGSLWLLTTFYCVAGLNHFIMPEFYYGLIPPWLPSAYSINIIAGIAEIILGLSMLYSGLRVYARWGIILMLIAFIPAHIYFIQIGACVPGGLCVPMWIAWLRLIVIHPLLMLWVWRVAR